MLNSSESQTSGLSCIPSCKLLFKGNSKMIELQAFQSLVPLCYHHMFAVVTLNWSITWLNVDLSDEMCEQPRNSQSAEHLTRRMAYFCLDTGSFNLSKPTVPITWIFYVVQGVGPQTQTQTVTVSTVTGCFSLRLVGNEALSQRG